MPCPITRNSYLARIHTLYAAIDKETKRQGKRWYRAEHDYAVSLARNNGHSLCTICACLAILSPRCQWPRVKMVCQDLLHGRTPTGIFGHNLRKAKRLLRENAENPIHPRQAPKTWAFWQNLWHPYDPYPVTLDAWMFRAHRIHPHANLGTYDALAQAYRIAAGDLNLIPNQLQAAIWLHTRITLHT